MRTFRTNERIHRDNLIGSELPSGWFMVIKAFYELNILHVKSEKNGLTYLAVWNES